MGTRFFGSISLSHVGGNALNPANHLVALWAGELDFTSGKYLDFATHPFDHAVGGAHAGFRPVDRVDLVSGPGMGGGGDSDIRKTLRIG